MATTAIYNATTGEIIAYVMVPDSDLTANIPSGAAALDFTDAAVISGQESYVTDPGGTPAISARPLFDSVIPDSLTAGDTLSITDVPDGATVTITSTGDGGGTHTKAGGLGLLDAAVTGAADGDTLTIEISLWPYRPMTGECLVSGV